MTDLGIVALNRGDVPRAIGLFEEALRLTRQLKDRSGEGDVLGNLGLAMLAAKECKRAFELFQQELTLARAESNQFAEKNALEHLGMARAQQHDFAAAITFFEQALALARQLGDRRQESSLLWQLAIQNAERGQRDQAIAHAEACVALMQKVGKPEAAWYAEHLSKYRSGQAAHSLAAPQASSGGSEPSLGDSILAGMFPSQPAPAPKPPPKGPSLLRMALTATKAMAQFVGSGFKKVSPDVYQSRIQLCMTCEHHTGLRCRLCGCFTNAKARLPHEECPAKKWPAMAQEQSSSR